MTDTIMKPSKSRVSPEALAKWRFSLLTLLYSTLLRTKYYYSILLLYLLNIYIYIFIFLYSANSLLIYLFYLYIHNIYTYILCT